MASDQPSDPLDLLEGDVPDVDAPPSPSEKARAYNFADLIDKAISGKTPPALSADERALLEVTTVIRAAAGHAELAPAPRRAVVEQALAAALGPAAAAAMGARLSAELPAQVQAQPQRSTRRARWTPWAVTVATTAMAAAAGVALLLRAPEKVLVSAPTPVPTRWTSRPADALVGEIRREDAGAAAARLDSIYSDRLDGCREATLFQPRGER